MQPTPQMVHRDAALSNISIAHKNPLFIADRLLPVVPVNQQSNYYYTFLKGAWFRNEAKPRAPGTRAPRSGYVLSDTRYNCQEYAFGHEIPVEVLNNADLPLRPWETATRLATNKVLLAKEVLVSSLLMTAATWGNNQEDANGLWAAGAGNTFFHDIVTRKETIRRLIGVNPNGLMIDAATFASLKEETTLLARIQYTGTGGKPADVTPQMLAALFELDEVVIGNAIQNIAKETKAGTEWSSADLWETHTGKGCGLLYYRPASPGLEIPAMGYSFNWKGDAGQQSQVVQQDVYRSARKYWEEAEKQWVVEASEYTDPQVTCADAGYLFWDTLLT